MKKKIFMSILLVIVVSITLVNVHASSLLDNIISQGNSFGNSGSTTSLGTELSDFIKGDVMSTVLAIGNLIFAAITVILGAKYIWSSAEGKSQVMESLPTFVVAIIFFYLGESLVTWLTGTGGLATSISGATSWTSISGKIIWIVNTIVHYAAFGGILFLGLKYMFASAEGKSQLKTNMGGLVLGMVFVFLASRAVDFIISLGESVI